MDLGATKQEGELGPPRGCLLVTPSCFNRGPPPPASIWGPTFCVSIEGTPSSSLNPGDASPPISVWDLVVHALIQLFHSDVCPCSGWLDF